MKQWEQEAREREALRAARPPATAYERYVDGPHVVIRMEVALGAPPETGVVITATDAETNMVTVAYPGPRGGATVSRLNAAYITSIEEVSDAMRAS